MIPRSQFETLLYRNKSMSSKAHNVSDGTSDSISVALSLSHNTKAELSLISHYRSRHCCIYYATVSKV